MDQVVEVQPASRSDRRFVGDECPGEGSGFGIGRDLGRVDPEIELEPRECRVEPAELGPRRVRPQLRHERGTVHQRFDGQTVVAQDLAAQGMEGADPNRPCRDTERGDGRVQAFRELLGRARSRRGSPVARPSPFDRSTASGPEVA